MADVCVYRDASTTNLAFPSTKPQKSSTRPSHRPSRPSIDKSQVSKPFPILTHDEKDLFDAMASGNFEARERRIPKAAEKKVKVDVSALAKPSPQHGPKAPADPPSRSWYTPAKPQPQPPATTPSQQSASSTTPRTIPPKTGVRRANATKVPRNRALVESESRRDGAGPAKRSVPKRLMTHQDCPRVGSTNSRVPHNGHVDQRQPVRFATRGSRESDRTAVEGDTRTRTGAKVAGLAVKPAHDTLRPTVRLISKPLPALPPTEPISSRYSGSTNSAFSSFSYRKVVDMFPKPPKNLLGLEGVDDWERSNSLSTPPVFMSCPNSSSSSVDTIAPPVAPDFAIKPLVLKAAPKPKVAAVVHQVSRASCSLSQLQDSIVIQDGRAYPEASVKGRIHTGPAPPALQRKPSPPTSSRAIERIKRERLERKKEREVELQKEQELKLFETEFGYNPFYKGKRSHRREMGPNGFEDVDRRKWV